MEDTHYLSKYQGEKKAKRIRNLLSCPEGSWKQVPEPETLDVCIFYMYQHMMMADQQVYPGLFQEHPKNTQKHHDITLRTVR